MGLTNKQLLQLAVKAASEAEVSKPATFDLDGTKYEYSQSQMFKSNFQELALSNYGSYVLDANDAAHDKAQGLNRAITKAIDVFGNLMTHHGKTSSEIHERKADLKKAVVKIVDDPEVGDIDLQKDAEAHDSFFNELLA